MFRGCGGVRGLAPVGVLLLVRVAAAQTDAAGSEPEAPAEEAPAEEAPAEEAPAEEAPAEEAPAEEVSDEAAEEQASEEIPEDEASEEESIEEAPPEEPAEDAAAEDEPADEESAETPTEPADEELPEVVVVGTKAERRLSGQELLDARAPSTADRLDLELGVSTARRGATGGEPFLRGWGGERVMTQTGPVPLAGACPGKMDPPVSYLRPGTVAELRLVPSVPSVIDGPWGTGGRIVATTDPGAAPENLSATIGGTFDSSRLGGSGFAQLSGGNDFLHLRGSVEAMGFGDYTSPSGIEVPSDQTEVGASLSAGFTGKHGHTGWVTGAYQRHQDIDYPALPMDLVSTDGVLADANHRWATNGKVVSAVETSAGVQILDHVMDNALRSNRGMMEARTNSKVRSGALRAKLETPLAEDQLLAWGLDGLVLSRDAWRNRNMVQQGMSFDDHLWPDALQTNVGAFSEWTAPLGDVWNLRLGARFDLGHSEAGGADDPSLGGTVREAYVRFYGEDAANTTVTTAGGAANALLQWRAESGLGAHAGLGLSTRPGAATERYFAFAPAPGGFLVGNPTLDPEKKGTLELGADWQSDWLDVELAGHGSRAGDYILQTTLAMQDINGDGTEDRVLGFVNVDAWVFGGEFAVTPKFLTYFSLPTSFEVLWGENASEGQPLPEIAPWELRTALHGEGGKKVTVWGEVGLRVVGEQGRFDEQFPENATDGFVVGRAEAGMRYKRWLDLSMSLENFTNEEYSEHLTRSALQPVGDLMPGDDVPAQGRRFLVTARSTF